MRNYPVLFLLLVGELIWALVGCSHDPNVRRQRYLESGSRYFARQQYRAAAIEYQNAIEVDSNSIEAHSQLAECYLKLGLWTAAYHQLTLAADLQPDNLKTQLEPGNLLLAARRFKEAQEKAEIVVQKEPNSVDGHVLLAIAEAGLQSTDAALREMQYAIQLDPNSSRSYLNLAFLQFNTGQGGLAEDSLKKAVHLDPQSVPAAMALGDFYQRQQRWAEAEQQLLRAIQLEPKNLQLHAALSTLYLAEGQKERAAQVLLEVKRALPGTRGTTWATLSNSILIPGLRKKSAVSWIKCCRNRRTKVGRPLRIGIRPRGSHV